MRDRSPYPPPDLRCALCVFMKSDLAVSENNKNKTKKFFSVARRLTETDTETRRAAEEKNKDMKIVNIVKLCTRRWYLIKTLQA